MVAKFEVGKTYLDNGEFAYMVLKRQGQSVWFWDLVNQDQVFRRTVYTYEWSKTEEAHSNVITVSGYNDRNYSIYAELTTSPERYVRFIDGMKKEYLDRIAQQVNKFGPYIVNGKVNRKMIR